MNALPTSSSSTAIAVPGIAVVGRQTDGKSALITLLVGLGLMVIGTFFTGENQEAGTTGWLKSWFISPYHYMGFVFLVLVVLQLALSQSGMKRASPYIQEDKGLVDLTPWKPAPYVGGALILLVLTIYTVFAV